MLERDLIQEPSPAVVVLFEDFLSSQEREQDLLIYGSHFRDQNGNRVDPAEVIIREDQPVSRVQQPAPFFMGTRHIYHIE